MNKCFLLKTAKSAEWRKLGIEFTKTDIGADGTVNESPVKGLKLDGNKRVADSTNFVLFTG